MSELLNQLKDEELDFTVKFTDINGKNHKGEFLDIILFEKNEYVIIEPEEDKGFVEIFKIMGVNGKEIYVPEEKEDTLEKVFEIFKIKNEDEFEF